MNQEERLKEKFGTDAGWKVPEGYFDSFYTNMETILPPMPQAPMEIKLSTWQRMKPYLYLAAMFAGIWVMMKVFTNVYQDTTMNIDNPPEHIAKLMASDPDLDLLSESAYTEDEDMDDFLGGYENISDFGKEMGIELDPFYQQMDIDKILNNDEKDR